MTKVLRAKRSRHQNPFGCVVLTYRRLVVAHCKNLSDPAILRTYANIHRNNDMYVLGGSMSAPEHYDRTVLIVIRLRSVKMWEACRATSAARTFFEPIRINGSRYSDGGLQRNNPVGIVHTEAAQVFPGRPIQLISLGTGDVRPSDFDPTLLTIAKQLAHMATETEHTAQEFQRSFEARRTRGEEGAYFRFSPEHLGDIGLEEAGKLSLIHISEPTRPY